MGRLRVLSGEEVCGILERNGFAAVRQRGSHRIMQKRLGDTTITVHFRFTIRLNAAHYQALSDRRSGRARICN